MVGAIRRICWRSAFTGTLSPVNTEPDAELPLEFQVLRAQPARFDRVLEHDQGAIERERLFKKIIGAEFGGFHRRFDRAMAADDDHLGPSLAGHPAHIAQHVQPVAVGQPDIEQHHVIRRVFNEDQRFRCRGRCGHAVALFAQNLFERRADLRLIVHNQNVVHE